MKKAISILLIIGIIFCLAGCGEGNFSKFQGTWVKESDSILETSLIIIGTQVDMRLKSNYVDDKISLGFLIRKNGKVYVENAAGQQHSISVSSDGTELKIESYGEFKKR